MKGDKQKTITERAKGGKREERMRTSTVSDGVFNHEREWRPRTIAAASIILASLPPHCLLSCRPNKEIPPFTPVSGQGCKHTSRPRPALSILSR